MTSSSSSTTKTLQYQSVLLHFCEFASESPSWRNGVYVRDATPAYVCLLSSPIGPVREQLKEERGHLNDITYAILAHTNNVLICALGMALRTHQRCLVRSCVPTRSSSRYAARWTRIIEQINCKKGDSTSQTRRIDGPLFKCSELNLVSFRMSKTSGAASAAV